MNKQILTNGVIERAKKIKLLLMDCDGVLTDGRLYYNENGEALKVFHVRDGQGLVTWHKAGFRSGIISGRSLALVNVRARELGIEFEAAKVSHNETAFIGDDVADVMLMNQVGLAVAVADALYAAKEAAHFVTMINGGCGAVREVTDIILQAQKKLPAKS